MKTSIVASITLSGLLTLSPAMAKTASTGSNYVNNNQTTNVQFKKGASGATYSGKVTGYHYHDYTFYAKKGQRLHPHLVGNVTPYLFSPKLSDSINLDRYSPDLDRNGDYILPYTGKYTIRIGQERAFARRGNTANYTLQIAIK